MAIELPDLPKHVFRKPAGLVDMPVGLPEEDKGNELLKLMHIELAKRAMARLNSYSAVSFSAKEQDWLQRFASACFRISYFIGDSINQYTIGRIAFLYGLAEAIALHKSRPIDCVPEQRDFDTFDKGQARAFAMAAPLDQDIALYSLRNESHPEITFGTLDTLHQARKNILDKKPYALVPFNLENPYFILALPVYLVAKDLAYQEIYPSSAIEYSQFIREEQERGLVQTIYGECPPKGEEGYLETRALWSRMVGLYKDHHLKNICWPAYALGNFLLGEVTGIPEYNRRLLLGSDLKLEQFFSLKMQPKPVYEEAVPKCVSSILDKALSDDQVASTIVSLAKKYCHDMVYDFDFENVDHQMSHVALRRRAWLFGTLVYAYAMDPTPGLKQELSGTLGEVIMQALRTRDIFRLRAFFDEGDLDQFCRETIVPSGIESYLKIQGRLSRKAFLGLYLPQDINSKEPLSTVIANTARSVETEIRDCYLKNDYHATNDVFGGVRVNQHLVIGGQSIPCEAQLFPLEMAKFPWMERTNYKAWRTSSH